MNINDIITDEHRNLLKEGYVMEDDKFNFNQVIENTTYLNYENFSSDYDVDISESNVIINWKIGFWLNEFGVESFQVKVIGVNGTYKVTLLDKQSDEKAQENEKNIGEIPWRYDIGDVDLVLSGALYVSSLIFDFATKVCEVTFQ